MTILWGTHLNANDDTDHEGYYRSVRNTTCSSIYSTRPSSFYRHHTMPSEPQLLYEVPNVSAFHLANGAETPLTAKPGSLSMLMVPTSTYNPFSETPEEEDFYLHLQLYPNIDLPLPATTHIFRQFPRSYLIPRHDLEDGSGSAHFTRIEFAENRSQDDVDTFETILAQCTAFLEKAPPPVIAAQKGKSPEFAGAGGASVTRSFEGADYGYYGASGSGAQANSVGGAASGYTPGEGTAAGQEYGYASDTATGQNAGRLVLVDEQDGRIVGELSEGVNVVEHNLQPGSKAPVEITLPEKGGSNQVIVAPIAPEIGEDYLSTAMHPAYQKSSMVSKAALASKFIVTTASMLGNAMETGANRFTNTTKPNETPLSFKPTTHENIRRIHTFTHGASGFSSKTVGKVQVIAQNIGARVAGKTDNQGNTRSGKETPSKPGILNKSMIAFSTIADGIDAASKHLLTTSSNAATSMIGHRYGDEARGVAHDLTSSVKNVGLVYVDAAGVSRRAVVKSVAKGMVLGTVKGGGEVIVGGDGSHGALIPPGEGMYPGGEKSSRPITPQPVGGEAPPPPYQLPSAIASTSSTNVQQQQQHQQYPDDKAHPGGNFF